MTTRLVIYWILLISKITDYRLIAIGLNKPTKLKYPQKVNFIGELEDQNNGATMFFVIEK